MDGQPQVVSLDWLAFSVTLAKTYKERLAGHATLQQPAGYVLVECNRGTTQYKRRHYLLTENGDKILTLLTEPHSKIIHADDMFVEVANPVLYNDAVLAGMMDILEQVHPFSFRSISRIDVACDFQPTPSSQAVIKGIQANSIYCTGKREGAQFHDYRRTVNGVEQTMRQISWGNKTSDWRYKVYNKSLEIYQPDKNGRVWCTKPYIVDRWRQNGMGDQDVWRMEVSLSGASTYDWRGEKIGWWMIERREWEQWYWDTIATRFVLRKNEGHLCRKNDTVVPLLDIPDGEHYRTKERVGDNRRESVDHAATLRACIQQLERPEVAYSEGWRNLWLNTTFEVLQRGHLHPYFQRTFGITFEEYAATVGDPLGASPA